MFTEVAKAQQDQFSKILENLPNSVHLSFLRIGPTTNFYYSFDFIISIYFNYFQAILGTARVIVSVHCIGRLAAETNKSMTSNIS